MTWTRLPDTFNTDPRTMRLSDAAFRLHVKALVWCNQHLTDGLVPEDALGMLLHRHPAPDTLVVELVRVGLWAEVAGEDSWQLDWTEQETASAVLARRARVAEKQARYRDRKSRHEAGDHSACDSRNCPDLRRPVTGNATGNETSNVMGRVTHSRPVPSRRDRDREGNGAAPEGGRRADAGPRCAECDRPEAACRAIPESTSGHVYVPERSAGDPEPPPVAKVTEDLGRSFPAEWSHQLKAAAGLK